jgi:RHS repeat-associated protein
MTDARALVTSYDYDLAGRRVRRYNGDTDDRYEFDEVGNLVRAANANAVFEYRYNERNLLSETRYPDLGMRVGYSYDPVGRMASLTYPGGEVTSYERDAAGQVTAVADSQAGRMTMGFDAAGRLTQEAWPNGLAVTRGYDTADHLLGIDPEHPDPKSIPAIHYTYDPRGNRLTMDRSDLGPSAYSYDEISQLLTAKLPGGDLQTYRFDPVGNRLSLQDRRGTQLYHYDAADQLLDIESDYNPEEPATPPGLAMARLGTSDATPVFRTSFTFDDAGNEVSKVGPGKRATNYGFDSLERLYSVESPGSVPERYLYDPEDRRCASLQGMDAVKTRFLRHARGRPVLLELDGSGKPETRYIILPTGQLLARVGPVDSKPVFYHFDALGSTVALTDASSRVVTRFDYDPYGDRRSHPATKELYGFIGAESVSEDGGGLVEMGWRFYDPDSGRFVSRDPLWGHLQGPRNAYTYARGNPEKLIDPTGLDEYGLTPEEMAAMAEWEIAAAKAAAEAVAKAAKAVADAFKKACAAVAKAWEENREAVAASQPTPSSSSSGSDWAAYFQRKPSRP